MTTIKPHKAAMEAVEDILDICMERQSGEMVLRRAEATILITEAYAPLVEAARIAVMHADEETSDWMASNQPVEQGGPGYYGGSPPDFPWVTALAKALRAIVGD